MTHDQHPDQDVAQAAADPNAGGVELQGKVTAYRLFRPNSGAGWMHAGATAAEVLRTFLVELTADIDSGLSAEECGQIIVEPYETTLAEIERLPEFEGW